MTGAREVHHHHYYGLAPPELPQQGQVPMQLSARAGCGCASARSQSMDTARGREARLAQEYARVLQERPRSGTISPVSLSR